MLLEAKERIATHPAPRGPAHMHVGRLRHRQFVAVCIQVAQAAGRARGEHRPDELAAARRHVVQPGLHHPLFHAGGHAFGAAHPDVIKKRCATNDAGVRMFADTTVVPPVPEVRPEWNGVAVVGLREKIPRVGCRERMNAFAQCVVHPRFPRHHAAVTDERRVAGDGSVLVVHVRITRFHHRQWRQIPVALLLETQRRMRAGQLSAGDGDFLVPGEWHEQDVFQEPGVVGLADAGGAGLLRRLDPQPADELLGRAGCRVDRGEQCSVTARCESELFQFDQRLVLFIERLDRTDPQILRIPAREVDARATEQWGNGAQFRGQVGRLLRAQRLRRLLPGARPDGVFPEPDRTVNDRTFFRGRVALLGLDRRVVRRITRPGSEHGEVVEHSVHFGSHEMRIDLFGNAPAGGIDGGEASLQSSEQRTATPVGGGGVIGNAGDTRRLLEGAPLGEERFELAVRPAGRLRQTGHGGRNAERGQGGQHDGQPRTGDGRGAHTPNVRRGSARRVHRPGYARNRSGRWMTRGAEAPGRCSSSRSRSRSGALSPGRQTSTDCVPASTTQYAGTPSRM